MKSIETMDRKKSIWTEDDLREITSSCLLGLEYLHEKGLVHGVIVWE